MTAFLDTDVLIDCLRGTSSAQEWLARAASETFQIPGIVAMALARSARLYTFNLRHFGVLPGFGAQAPYLRS